MTYRRIVRQAAAAQGIPFRKAEALVSDVLQNAAKQVLTRGTPIRLSTLGHLTTRRLRAHGRTPSGTAWEKPGRRVLTLRSHVVRSSPTAAPSAQ